MKIRERMKTWKERRQLKKDLKVLDWLAKKATKGHEPKRWAKLKEEERERAIGMINREREEIIAKIKARK